MWMRTLQMTLATLLVAAGFPGLARAADIDCSSTVVCNGDVADDNPTFTSLAVGDSAAGTVEISGGAFGTPNNVFAGFSSSGHGTIVVKDAGTIWTISSSLTTGLDGTGVVTVRDAAEVNVSGQVAVGSGATSRAMLNLSSGGVMSSGQIAIGQNGGAIGTVNVDGVDSHLDLNTATFFPVGQSGTGALYITNGGLVDTGTFMSLGHNPGSIWDGRR